MKFLSPNSFNEKHNFFLIGFVMVVLFLCGFIIIRQNNPIVGTWIGLHSTNATGRWVFTSNNKFKEYYHNKLDEEYTYKLSQTPNHCGVDMSDRLNHFPNNRILILTNTKTGKKTCSLVYKLTDNRLILSSYQAETASGVDTLKKVQ